MQGADAPARYLGTQSVRDVRSHAERGNEDKIPKKKVSPAS